MAKRFTDTDKWKKNFYSELSLKGKLAWIYLLDNCDNTGVWPINFKLMSFQIGFPVNVVLLVQWFGPKLTFIDQDKLFIRSFIDFQYGELNEANNAHKPVLSLLKKLEQKEPLNSSLLGVQDKDKDKDKDMDKEKEEEGKALGFDLEAIYSAYPRKEGKKIGIARLEKIITTQEKFDSVFLAVQNYAKQVQGTDLKFIKLFSSFVSNWEDYLEVQVSERDQAINFLIELEEKAKAKYLAEKAARGEVENA